MSIMVTGSAGFIGFHVAKTLLERGEKVVGYDNVNDYYDQDLKWARNSILEGYDNYKFYHKDLCDYESLEKTFDQHNITRMCHLAAQAGVRYSIDNPQAYQRSNLEAFTNVLEVCRHKEVDNLVFASSSSVYGGCTEIPFSEDYDITHPISFYAATKVANEVMAHSYHHLYGIPCSGLRFFTVYGPWGRPDMAMYLFTENMLQDKPIDVFNYGNMKRDFTYIDDIVSGVISSIDNPFDYEIFNLGNHTTVNLMYVINKLEEALGIEAEKNMLPMQPGDVEKTYADISKAKNMLGFEPKTSVEKGIEHFVEWYKKYHDLI